MATLLFFFCRKIIIADPTAKEEEVTSGSFTVIANEENKIIYLERSGKLSGKVQFTSELFLVECLCFQTFFFTLASSISTIFLLFCIIKVITINCKPPSI